MAIANLPGLVGNALGTFLRERKQSILLFLVSIVGLEEVQQIISTGKFQPLYVPEWLADAISGPAAAAEGTIGAPLFDFLVRAPSGVSLSGAASAQEATAVHMVQRMLGFAVALPLMVTELESVLKWTLGENAGAPYIEAVKKIPEELGINWALGNVLDRIMEVAASQPIEEAIAEQTRPARLEWPQIRALARQKAIPPPELRERLARSGWRDSDIELIEQIDRQLLTVGDLQQAYLFGLIDQTKVHDILDSLGYNEEDARLITEVYLKRAETAGGDQLRSVAQRGYLDGHLSEEAYRGFLAQANVPQRSIDLEVEAANLVRQWGRVTLSVADIKKLRTDGAIDDAQARQRLGFLGYTEEDAQALIEDWKVEAKRTHVGITEARILAYLIGGVIDKTQAYDKLLSLGLSAADASFLVQHPQATPQVKPHTLSDSTVIAAYKDDILTQPQAESLLESIGHSADDAKLQVRIANVALNRGKKPKQAAKVLNDAQVIDAIKFGLATDTWAVRELVTLGYSEQDAMLIVTTELTKLSGNIPDTWTQLT